MVDPVLLIIVVGVGVLVRNMIHGPPAFIISCVICFISGILAGIFSSLFPIFFALGFVLSAFLWRCWLSMAALTVCVLIGLSVGGFF